MLGVELLLPAAGQRDVCGLIRGPSGRRRCCSCGGCRTRGNGAVVAGCCGDGGRCCTGSQRRSADQRGVTRVKVVKPVGSCPPRVTTIGREQTVVSCQQHARQPGSSSSNMQRTRPQEPAAAPAATVSNSHRQQQKEQSETRVSNSFQTVKQTRSV